MLGQSLGCCRGVSKGVPPFTPTGVVGDRFEDDGDRFFFNLNYCCYGIDDLDLYGGCISKRADLDSISVLAK